MQSNSAPAPHTSYTMPAASNRRRKLDAIINEAMHRCKRNQRLPGSAPVCSILPPTLQVGVQRGDGQLCGFSHPKETVTCEFERRRLPVISSTQLNSMTDTGTCSTSSSIVAASRFDHYAARCLLTMKIDGDTVGERVCLTNKENTVAAQEVYSEALGLEARRHRTSAIRTRPCAAPGRSILAVSSTRSRNFDLAVRRRTNDQRRKRQGMPATVSFGAFPLVHQVDVHPGNRLRGLPAGAIRSTKHLPRRIGLGAL